MITWVIPEGFEHWIVCHVTHSAMTSSSDTNVMIGVLTTGPRLQNACNDTFLQPNHYTYSNSDLEVIDFDLTKPTECDATILSQSNRHTRPTFYTWSR
jgi:hypothetical protein